MHPNDGWDETANAVANTDRRFGVTWNVRHADDRSAVLAANRRGNTLAECIHGFDEGMCAICFPAPEPEKPQAPVRERRAPSARSSGTTRPSARPARAKRPAGASRPVTGGDPVRDIGEHRVYHVTHLDNLPGILDAGTVLPFESVMDVATPVVDIASPEHRQARRSTEVAGARVSTMVPFMLSPDAGVWAAVRSGRADARLGSTAFDHPSTEYVVLVAPVAAFRTLADAAEGHGYVITDRDASDPGARAAVGDVEGRRLLSRIVMTEGDAARDAELLVPGPVPFDRIGVVGVANEKVRDLVRAALRHAGFPTRVVVYPPWFRPEE
jgi:hypothetical protein